MMLILTLRGIWLFAKETDLVYDGISVLGIKASTDNTTMYLTFAARESAVVLHSKDGGATWGK